MLVILSRILGHLKRIQNAHSDYIRPVDDDYSPHQ